MKADETTRGFDMLSYLSCAGEMKWFSIMIFVEVIDNNSYLESSYCGKNIS